MILATFSIRPLAANSKMPDDVQSAVSSKLATLTAPDGQASDYFGYSVAVHGDTAVVGALATIDSDPQQGAVYVFTKSASGWADMKQVAKLTASDGMVGDKFGISVSTNGDTVVAGAPGAMVGSNFVQGAVYVFVKPRTGWKDMTETAKLTTSDGSAYNVFGWCVSLSPDGEVIVGGISTSPSQVGQVVPVFVKPASGWRNMTQTAELAASDSAGAFDNFGASVATNGRTVVVGAPGVTTNSSGAPLVQGATYVFVEPTTGWADMTQTAKLTASNGGYGDYLGSSVAISDNTIVSGAPGALEGAGAVYVFVKPDKGWFSKTETVELTSGVFGDVLGWSVAIDKDLVLAGAPQWPAYHGPGFAYLFQKPNTGWRSTSKFNKKLSAPEGAENDYFGYSVAIGDSAAVIGAYGVAVGSNSQQGSAYVIQGLQ